MKNTIKTGMMMLILSATLLACKEEKKVEETDPTIPVKIISSAALTQSQPVQTSGLLGTENEANLSFKVGGIINTILVKEGDKVRKGQLLATLNATEFAAQMAQAEENFMKAKRDAQRTQNLFRDSVNTKEQLENSLTTLHVAEKQLDIVRFNLSQAKIYATTDGVVIQKLKNPGEQVAGGSPVLYISSTNNKDWVIKCGLTDKDWTRLKGGEKAEIVFDAYPQTFSGSIATLSQGSDAGSGLYQAEIRLDKQPAKLANGLFAKVSIYPKQKTEMISVPVDALIEGDSDSAFVFVAANGKALKKQVKVAFLEGEKAFILSGIDAGAQIIREGSAYLADGSAIKIVQ
ncbi:MULTISPECIES: efflux RND transporter periplasmic adaptor subunit [Dyadobacter]|uniref:Efflux RND transporter periplasmic adaptor subunit n=1 Tax=Dyadobacter chenhuakuii TaxID=2909339 RepID=A0A9X1TS71_9BACT|nr:MULTISPECIES: efflux RND transporter periplasmic adaptor subunit [Dyadobacter]MCE7072699.1 efflux RND transporter periplasmic adaptor subunit [Dyadobacter sp. CY327]MCF2497755.1 efflux RND transporter periplasmic adaptor subunit [Dyadobacter chenhuakuii]MCF2517260.1 efflux RND transporter periplasmic adaptor subunit [Dyadobacter sp. CY351]